LELLHEGARLVGEAVVGQIAAEGEDVGGFADLREQRLQRPWSAGASEMQIAERGNADCVFRRHAPAMRSKPGATLAAAELLVDGGERLLEHLPVGRDSGPLEVRSCTRPRELEPLASRAILLFLRAEALGSGPSSGRLLLLELDHLRLEASR